ncbi:MAG: hypothetical protein U1B30_08180 [Pseudomonadota bacterium]|nr:hypothetical protein [Pseudomonadota bacterium]
MAEIDTNPLTPVWPQRPQRKIDPEDKGAQQHPRRKKQDDLANNNKDDDSSFHIDEYA